MNPSYLNFLQANVLRLIYPYVSVTPLSFFLLFLLIPKAYMFRDYWEDIGTIKTFYDANLALTEAVCLICSARFFFFFNFPILSYMIGLNSVLLEPAICILKIWIMELTKGQSFLFRATYFISNATLLQLFHISWHWLSIFHFLAVSQVWILWPQNAHLYISSIPTANQDRQMSGISINLIWFSAHL